MKQYSSSSLKENEAIVAQILDAYPDKRIFALSGDLGAGKTALTQAFCAVLGVKSAVSSPTFGLVNEYLGERDTIYHFDFYRIRRLEEAYDIGLEEYLDSGNYCFIEWPEMIEGLLPEETILIKIQTLEAGKREIKTKII